MSDVENLASQENLVSQPDPSVASEETPAAPTQMEINGKMYEMDQVESVMGRSDKMDGAHTQRSQALADERREWETQRDSELASIETQRAALTVPEVDTDDEVARLHNQIADLRGVVEKDISNRNDAVNRFTAENAMEDAMARFDNAPIADTEGTGAMKQWLTDRNLGPEFANDAYQATFGALIAEARGEMNAAARIAPAVMHSTGTGVSPGITSPGDVQTEADIGDKSWDQIRDEAMRDPDLP